MRWLLALAGAVTLALSVNAQAQTAPAQPLQPSHIAAARETIQVVFLDSDAVGLGAGEALQALAPRFRAQLPTLPLYAGLTPAHQQALLASLERMPGPVAAAARAQGPALADEFAPRLAALVSPEDLAVITAFFRTPEGRAIFMRNLHIGLAAAAGQQAPTLTPLSEAETAAEARFRQTHAGELFYTSPELSTLFNEFGERSTSNPAVGAAMKHELCVSIEEQCPAEWR